MIAKSIIFSIIRTHFFCRDNPVLDANYLRSLETPRILVTIHGLIGDSVMSLPLLESISSVLPDAKLFIICNPTNQAFFESSPNVMDNYVISGSPLSLRESRQVAVLRSWIRKCKFDAAFIALGNDLASLPEIQRIPLTVGVKEDSQSSMLTKSYSIGTPRTWRSAERLGALRSVGFSVSTTTPHITPNSSHLDSLFTKISAIGLDTNNVVVVHPFGSTVAQHWPVENVKQFVLLCLGNTNLHIAILGGPSHTSLTIMDRKVPNLDDRLFDLRGILELGETVELIRQSKILVSTDSGPMHIGIALDTLTIGLFRSVRPEHAWQGDALIPHFGKSQRCEGRCTWDRCYWSPCEQMASISATSVFDQLNSLLGSSRGEFEN